MLNIDALIGNNLEFRNYTQLDRPGMVGLVLGGFVATTARSGASSLILLIQVGNAIRQIDMAVHNLYVPVPEKDTSVDKKKKT